MYVIDEKRQDWYGKTSCTGLKGKWLRQLEGFYSEWQLLFIKISL